jgi:hypothetical protein
MIARIAKDHGLKKRWERLREKGMLTLDEMKEAAGHLHRSGEGLARRGSSMRSLVITGRGGCGGFPDKPN